MTTAIRIVESRYERLEQIAWWDQDRLSKARVLVAGVGAIGNEILKHLALLGIGRIVLVDFDEVDVSNLSRSILFRAGDRGRRKTEVACERLREINPELRILPIDGDLLWSIGLGLVRRMDVVLAGLDSAGARLALNRMCWLTGVPWIDGAIDELSGTVRVFVPPEGACFECGLSDQDYREMSRRYSCQLVPRDAPLEMPVPTTSTAASVVAAWQVQEAVKWLHGKPLAASRGISFYGLTFEVFKPTYQRRSGCPAHDSIGEVVRLPGATIRTTVAELLQQLAGLHGGDVEIEIDREIIVGISCASCGDYRRLLRPVFRFDQAGLSCPRCGARRVLHLCHRLPDSRVPDDASLQDLGIPPVHILKATGRDGTSWYFELTGDCATEPFAAFLNEGDKHSTDGRAREDDDGHS